MSHPLCCIGSAVLEVIGLNPRRFDYRSEAHWAENAVFDDEPFYQPTGLGPRVMTLHLAARPHVMGGLGAYAALKDHHEAQDVVPFIRLMAGNIGEVVGDVAIRRLGHGEEKIAPDGLGYRHEFDVELLVVGRRAGGF